MTMPDVPNGEDYQEADEYPVYFESAVLPADLAPSLCDHDANAPTCFCVHDWRISWGNLPKKTGRIATYVSGG
jgi:hypothetical protein